MDAGIAGWVSSLGDTQHKSHSLSDKPFEVPAHADYWDMNEGSSFCATKVIYFQGQSLSKWKHASQHHTKRIFILFHLKLLLTQSQFAEQLDSNL